MKKTLAIVLALVMVFAIASTAFAAIGFTPNKVGDKDAVTLSVALYDYNEDVKDKPYWSAHVASYGIKADTECAAKITLTIPAFFDTGDEPDKTDWQLWMAVSNAGGDAGNDNVADKPTITKVDQSGKNAAGDTVDPIALEGDEFWEYDVDNRYLYVITGFETREKVKTAATYTYFVEYTAAAKNTNSVVEAQFFQNNHHTYDGVITDGMTIAVGGVDLFVKRTSTASDTDLIDNPFLSPTNVNPAGTNYYYVTDGTNAIWFESDDDSDAAGNYTVDSVYYYDAKVDATFQAYVFGSKVTLKDETGAVNTNSDVVARYVKLLGRLGFTMDGEATVLNDEGFYALAGTYTSVYASATFYAYTTTLTVSGPSKVPDTGDMNVVGIVMIALALVAAAAVTVKKVRA